MERGAQPEPWHQQRQLNGAASVSANDVWAVGQTTAATGFQTLAEHWDGTAWTVVPTPNPAANETSCPLPRRCPPATCGP